MTALITGASRGVGRAAALELGRRGVPLALLGRPSPRLEETRDALRGVVRTEFIPCELADPGQIDAAAARALELFGAPSIVVHNAGVVRRGPFEATTTASWNEQLDVNLRAPFLLTRALLPAMRARRAGRILHIASISATVGSPNAAAYAASKWGLVGLMKSLAAELSGSGLMTVAILPGSIDTDMLVGSGFAPRMTADDVARTIAYHALEAPLAHNGGVVEMFGT